ncbi:MAG: hypothetical protein GY847_18620 [Proteobacteria bacterium]|nr:hypothetical protein [Pseudomonadota bacterium]
MTIRGGGLLGVLLFLFATDLNSQGSRKDNVMDLNVKIDVGSNIVGYANGVPVIPIGHDIHISAKTTNKSQASIKIESPKTTRLIWGHLCNDEIDEDSFMLNPPFVDGLGEVSRPLPEYIDLAPGKSIEFSFSIYKFLKGRCFGEGVNEFWFSYNEINESEHALYILKFTPESVENLLDIVKDKSEDSWIREQAFHWLKKVRPNFKYSFDSTSPLFGQNKQNIEAYRVWWEENRDKKEVLEKFEQNHSKEK